MAVDLSDVEIVTEPCRISFPALFEPKPVAKNNPDLKYQAAVLIPPDVDLAPFYAVVKAAMIAKFGKVIKLPAKSNPIHSCDDKDLDGYDEGWHFVNVKSGYQPSVVDQKRQEVIDASRVYAGCWCRFHLSAYAWDHPQGGRGVSFSLNAVQLVREGERLDGRRAVKDVFDAVDVSDDEDFASYSDESAEELFG
jgi:hypothetical protein